MENSAWHLVKNKGYLFVITLHEGVVKLGALGDMAWHALSSQACNLRHMH